jgi:hypothetical protein
MTSWAGLGILDRHDPKMDWKSCNVRCKDCRKTAHRDGHPIFWLRGKLECSGLRAGGVEKFWNPDFI